MYIFIMTLCGCVILVSMLKTHRLFRSLVLSAVQGAAAVFAVNFIGEFTGLHISLNWFSAAVSSIGGLPGVIFLVMNNLFALL